MPVADVIRLERVVRARVSSLCPNSLLSASKIRRARASPAGRKTGIRSARPKSARRRASSSRCVVFGQEQGTSLLQPTDACKRRAQHIVSIPMRPVLCQRRRSPARGRRRSTRTGPRSSRDEGTPSLRPPLAQATRHRGGSRPLLLLLLVLQPGRRWGRGAHCLGLDRRCSATPPQRRAIQAPKHLASARSCRRTLSRVVRLMLPLFSARTMPLSTCRCAQLRRRLSRPFSRVRRIGPSWRWRPPRGGPLRGPPRPLRRCASADYHEHLNKKKHPPS